MVRLDLEELEYLLDVQAVIVGAQLIEEVDFVCGAVVLWVFAMHGPGNDGRKHAQKHRHRLHRAFPDNVHDLLVRIGVDDDAALGHPVRTALSFLT